MWDKDIVKIVGKIKATYGSNGKYEKVKRIDL